MESYILPIILGTTGIIVGFLLAKTLGKTSASKLLLEAKKEMDHLAAHLKETIRICTLDEGKMVVTAMATGNEHFHVASHIGSRTPINWTGSTFNNCSLCP